MSLAGLQPRREATVFIIMISFSIRAIWLLIGCFTFYNNFGQSIRVLPDSLLLSWMVEYRIPATGIGYIYEGKILHTKVLGELQKGKTAPQNTLFQVASLTKPIVEMTALRLVSQGLWSLDEPLYFYWVDPDVKADPTHRKLTTRHVLRHQTGFVNWRWLHPSKKLTFDFEPGTRTQYSGEGLEYLKKAMEAHFKMTLQEIVNKYLFLPDGMTDTHFFWDDQVEESRYAVAHNKDGKAYEIRKNKEASAADLMMTTVEDYCRFASGVLKKKNISSAVWQEMIHLEASDQKSNFGLGWEIYTGFQNGEFVLMHTGSDPGVRTIVVLLPNSGTGLIVLTNGDNGMELILKVITEALEIGPELVKMG